MRIEEAEWIKDALAAYGPEDLSPLIDLGSSTAHFREVIKPYINEFVFRPLESRGVNVVHVDAKDAPGVDIHGDFFSDELQQRVADTRPRAIICANMLEHIEQRDELVSRCAGLLDANGLLIVTVPHSYPYHPDPIDTGYRPSPSELRAQLRGFEIVDERIVDSDSFGGEVAKRPSIGVKAALRLLAPFAGVEKWKSAVDRLRWLARPYQVTCVVARKL